MMFLSFSINNLRFYWHWQCVPFLKGTLLFLLQDHHRSTFISRGSVDDHEWQANWISPGNQYSETLPSLSRGEESLETNNGSRLLPNKRISEKKKRFIVLGLLTVDAFKIWPHHSVFLLKFSLLDLLTWSQGVCLSMGIETEAGDRTTGSRPLLGAVFWLRGHKNRLGDEGTLGVTASKSDLFGHVTRNPWVFFLCLALQSMVFNGSPEIWKAKKNIGKLHL